MQISGISQLHGPQSLSGPHGPAQANDSGATSAVANTSDELQLSSAGQAAALLSDVPDVRQDRVSALRDAIQSGTYETPERLSGAVDRLLDEIG